jgi:hypothetical protein
MNANNQQKQQFILNKPNSPPSLQNSQYNKSDQKFLSSSSPSPTLDGSNNLNQPVRINTKIVNIISKSDSDREINKDSSLEQNEPSSRKNIIENNRSSELENRSNSPISGGESLPSFQENKVSPNLPRESNVDESAKKIPNNSSPNLNNNNPKGKNLNEFKKFSNKVLVEKDGQFKLLTPEEYMAYEKESRMPKVINNKSNRLIKFDKSKPNANIVHSNSRPKTSLNLSHKQSPAKIKSKQGISPVDGGAQSYNFSEQIEYKVKRNSSSADFSSREKLAYSPFKTHSTPDYAVNYTSPYKLTVRIYKQNNQE